MSLPKRSAHTAGVLAALVDAGLLADVARKPSDVPVIAGTKIPAKAYGVLYPLPEGARGGPVGAPDDDVAFTFQLTCVAADPTAAEDFADDAEAALQTVAVEGRTVTRLEPLPGSGGVRRDDDETPPLYYATPQWRLHTTPA